MQHGRIELAEADRTEQSHGANDLVFHQFEHAYNSRLAAGGETVTLHTTQSDQACTHRDRLDDIAAAIEAAVDDHLGAAGDRFNHFRHNVGRAAAMIELAAAVIGDVDELEAMFHAELGDFRVGDTFDRERYFVFRLDAIDGLPVERGLIFAA